MREAWTDERLDDLSHRVDEGFREFREEMRALRSEMNTRFDRVEARLESMQRTMILSSVGMTGAIVATLIGLIATQL